jgi:peptidoglycan/LPS O-acetylase OafA/YrhL
VIALLIHATSIFSSSPLGRVLEWKPLAYLGTISYSVYIWQQPFLCTPIHSPKDLPLRILLTLIVAALSYHCLERPLIKVGKKFAANHSGSNVASEPTSEAPGELLQS